MSRHEPPTVTPDFVRGDQPYWRLGSIPHTRRDGILTTLDRWRSHCATCGDEFETQTSHGAEPDNRRCAKHRRPGSPVAKGKRR